MVIIAWSGFSAKQAGAFTFNVTIAGNGSGSVNSSPSGVISCTFPPMEGTCSSLLGPASQLTLVATRSGDSVFNGWGDSCAACSGTLCQITMDGDKSCSATFATLPPVRIAGSTPVYYGNLQEAFDAAPNGATVEARAISILENLIIKGSGRIRFKGGYDGSFTSQSGYSNLKGKLTIRTAAVIADHLRISATPPHPVSLTSIAVTPANPEIAQHATQQFAATGSYSDGTSRNLTASVAWSSGSTSVATVNGAGLATGTTVGSATITATSGLISGSSTLSVTPSATGRFSEPATPLDVSALSDSAHAVTVLVPISGGTVTATGADGTVFTLEIPADALLSATEITMTPINGITDLPLSGGLGAAVSLEPEGLRLYNYATLTIVPARAIPLAQQTFFGFQNSGEDFHLEPPVPGSSALQIKLLHFSGYGMGSGTDADRAQILLHNASNAENRLNQAASERLRLARERNEPVDLTVLEEFWREFMDQVVAPRMQAASSSCAAGKLAMQTLLGLERQKQLMGVDSDGAMDLFMSLRTQLANACIQEAYDACVNQHDLREIVWVVLGLERQTQLLGLTDTTMPWDAAGKQMIKQCLHFELDFTSANGQSGMWDSSVTGTVPLQADLGEYPSIKVRSIPPSPLEAGDFTFTDWCEQTGIAMSNTGDFMVTDLKFVFGGTDTQKISTIEMEYYIPQIFGIATIKCDDDHPPAQVPLAWNGTYLVVHEFEATEGMGTMMIARNWTVPGGSLYASKSYDMTGPSRTFDKTTMVLRHTPGP